MAKFQNKKITTKQQNNKNINKKSPIKTQNFK